MDFKTQSEIARLQSTYVQEDGHTSRFSHKMIHVLPPKTFERMALFYNYNTDSWFMRLTSKEDGYFGKQVQIYDIGWYGDQYTCFKNVPFLSIYTQVEIWHKFILYSFPTLASRCANDFRRGYL